MTKWVSKGNRIVFLVLSDAAIGTISVLFALWILKDCNLPFVSNSQLSQLLIRMPAYLLGMVLVYYIGGLYRSLWKYAGSSEVCRIAVCSFITSTLFVMVSVASGLDFPRSGFILNYLALFFLTICHRFAYRALREVKHWLKAKYAKVIKHRILIIGAGDAGVMLLREIAQSERMKTSQVVCFVDDDMSKQRQCIREVPVVGRCADIPEVVAQYDVNEIILAIPSVGHARRKEILRLCQGLGCELKMLPGTYQLVNGEVSIEKIREVSVYDLLEREPIVVSDDLIKDYVRNQVVLVTGGGGSIGSELCRQIAGHSPKQLIIFDICENGTYDIEQELRRKYPKLHLTALIGSVRDSKRINSVMRDFRPDIIYHAAAHKHVPLMEVSPNESIKNNVFGTYKTVKAADKYGVKKFVLISTDKAVNPTNIMGATKRICEMIVQSFSRKSATEFVAVRFGNVLGSSGSVIPLFKKQIEEGGPVTVTHPDIVRYFMTIPEAVSLVLEAGVHAKGGQIFVLDMGKQVKILDLAENMIRLCGLKPGEDIEIEFTGLRPGEKLYEEKLIDEEGLLKTDNDLIHIAKPITFDETKFYHNLDMLYREMANDEFDVRTLVSEIVPTYMLPQDVEDMYEKKGVKINSVEEDRRTNKESLKQDVMCS